MQIGNVLRTQKRHEGLGQGIRSELVFNQWVHGPILENGGNYKRIIHSCGIFSTELKCEFLGL